jgi:hypothetical protein
MFSKKRVFLALEAVIYRWVRAVHGATQRFCLEYRHGPERTLLSPRAMGGGDWGRHIHYAGTAKLGLG